MDTIKDMDIIKGKIFVLDNNIDTDQIIPAQYLNLLPSKEEERRELGSYALCGLPPQYKRFIKEGDYKSEYNIIIAGKNFGCGSSREHAPIALNAAGIVAIVAQSYSRIFFRNSINAGLLFPFVLDEKICDKMQTNDEVEIDTNKYTLTHIALGIKYSLESLGECENIIKSGGIFEYSKGVL